MKNNIHSLDMILHSADADPANCREIRAASNQNHPSRVLAKGVAGGDAGTAKNTVSAPVYRVGTTPLFKTAIEAGSRAILAAAA